MPYDSSRRGPSTSTTNIGFDLVLVPWRAGQGFSRPRKRENGWTPRSPALKKRPKFLGGFPVLANVDTLQSTESQFSTVDHLSNLSASLVAVKGIVPDLAGRIDKILTPMDWGDLYEPSQGLEGGWRLDKKEFDVHQKGWDGDHSYLGADTRFGVVWGIGTSQIPLESWRALNRKQETKYGFSYFLPGWQGGGAFYAVRHGSLF